MSPRAVSALGERLARLTREGELYEALPNGRVRCFACGHRCLIPPGFDGVCRVRFNEDGVLRVPWGYVGGVQVDPVEKKPFFHALPGARALSFGMLGCDFHCGYCFTGDTVVSTADGPATFEELFESCERHALRHDAEVAFGLDRSVHSASGMLRRVKGVVRHPYRGDLVRVRPLYLPALRCTPDHRVYATLDPAQAPSLIKAGDLTPAHMLAVPRRLETRETPGFIDVGAALAEQRTTYRVSWSLSRADRDLVASASAAGLSSRVIASTLGKSASYIRHVRAKLARGRGDDTRCRGAAAEDGRVRFPGERRPGIAARLAVDVRLAALLGYYCAEGCVLSSRDRPNSHTIVFAFGHSERALAERVRQLVAECLGLEARLVLRSTTLGVTVGKTTAALLFKTLAGAGSRRKRVPACIADAPPEIARRFLDAYVEGDGHRYESGKVAVTTVSRDMAYGVAALVHRLGRFASVYEARVGPEGVIQGRKVHRAPVQYSVVWYEQGRPRRLVTTDDHYLVPLRSLDREPFDGDVYNMEVEEEHSYLAGFFGVSNCQNWLTSQALRDPDVNAPAREASPQDLVRLALKHDAQIVTSTYNEPLITSEWGMAVFREARAAGLVCSYVSNGNATPEVLDYIQPLVSLYKVDLKSFRDRHYRELGGTLERVLWTIRALHERGIWLEVVTLVIPGFNDSDEELREIAQFLVSVSPDIPWHVTAFHKDYKMTDPADTDPRTLLRAAGIGAAAGLRFVYAGNLPGRLDRWENTYCPGCRALLVERVGYRILQNRLAAGCCPDCGRTIPGFWRAPVA